MKKVLIIEDRTQRQEQFLSHTGIKLNEYHFVENKTGISYTKFKENILADISILNKYEVIISHRSAFEQDNARILDLIKQHCKNEKKYLILFSGGITTSYYVKEPYEQLSLNSKDFYSQNLKLFLDEVDSKNINLLLLALGKKWKLNAVLNTLEKLNSLTSDDFDDFDDFYNSTKTNLKTLNEIIDFRDFDSEEFSAKTVDKVKQKILNHINDELGIYYE